MVLTALTVGALYCLYKWYEKGLKGIPWLAILLMSCGTLTKGPVGTIIPCLVVGIFLLLRGVNFFKAFLLLSAWAILSLILPICWYVAAYQQGGEEFIALVMEENLGRMTNTMSYDSCVNPWHYGHSLPHLPRTQSNKTRKKSNLYFVNLRPVFRWLCHTGG